MTGLFLTRNATPILSQFAAILGWLIERIFDLLYSMGTPSVGLAIILFTIVVYTLMIPLTYKQQKFARMSVRMNPEIHIFKHRQRTRPLAIALDHMTCFQNNGTLRMILRIIHSEEPPRGESSKPASSDRVWQPEKAGKRAPQSARCHSYADRSACC